MTDDNELARAQISERLSHIAMNLHDATDEEDTLDCIATHALTAVGGDDAGILLLASKQHVRTVAATSQAVHRADELQTELGEGPCLDATDGESDYLIRNTRYDQRWPRWSAAVVELEYSSVLGVSLHTNHRQYGALNLYGIDPEAFTADELATATIFARHAIIALAGAQERDGLKFAMDSRHAIGLAQGLLMGRYDLNADRAFAVLRRYLKRPGFCAASF